jgi:hypothetical protein
MSRKYQGPESIQPRAKISEPWTAEVELRAGDSWLCGTNDNAVIIVNLVSNITGEIRQKRVSVDTLARRVFASEISTWKKKYGDKDDWMVKVEPILEAQS